MFSCTGVLCTICTCLVIAKGKNDCHSTALFVLVPNNGKVEIIIDLSHSKSTNMTLNKYSVERLGHTYL